ncbi:UDP-Gal or UDP-GlcNAc-dependent glycosyltransferase [Trypanosoma theileri]|uniref:Hexosyltransferase n=1 Tax=Trypanosoma theileri TaxID=67003 RepID=A0A1X0NPY4_9TRYP|nr:UDP-Gal or UDP-GlcNAc-dependent glycosyltransferase [Trypanosoma theileri]ORC86776.1 UDP-Gal or UDP-GlcNAc-dependent glycosyltransferase [Trypanosoma theileri]
MKVLVPSVTGKRVFYAVFFCILLVIVELLWLDYDSLLFSYSEEGHFSHRSLPPLTLKNVTESLRYIPHSTIQTWRERDYLIVFGIPSIDIEARRRRRDLQRTTCWQFPGVARRANDFTGAMLVLYVLARHPSQGYNYSAALEKESDEWHDIITLPMNDVLPTTNKTIGGNGYWGTEAEIGMSRKTYFWYELALRVFPNVNYISKGDDDMFMRVPQFLSDLRLLPRRGTYMGGYYGVWRGKRANPPNVYFMIGYCMTLARDVALQLVSFKPIQRLVHLPYSKEREPEFKAFNMEHEDIMVGRVLLHEINYEPLRLVKVDYCRFFNIRNKSGHYLVTSNSIVIHHLEASDYSDLMRRFGNIKSPVPSKLYLEKHNVSLISCI